MKYLFNIFFLHILLQFAFCTNTGNEKITDDKEKKMRDSGYAKLTSKIIQINDGYGYEIYIDETKYIKQDIIPAIPGLQTFVSPEDAQKAANLTMYKMARNILPPSISIEELDSMKITYNK